MHQLKVFLAEDHLVVREGLRMLIDAQPDMQVVGEAGDGLLAVQMIVDAAPDVVVMDVSMPGLNGIQVTKNLKESKSQVKVLALTVHENKAYLRELLSVGASGYILKKAAAEELINAIRGVCSGGIYLDPALTGLMVDELVQQNGFQDEQAAPSLSQREEEVTRLIAQGFSNKEIAGQLDISVKTVETYKYRVMEKLDLNSRADLVQYALKQGWLS